MIPLSVLLYLVTGSLPTIVPLSGESCCHDNPQHTPCRCRRLQLALIRSLFLLQDPESRELIRDHTIRERTFSHLLLHGREIPLKAPIPLIKAPQVVSVNLVEGYYTLVGKIRGGRFLGVEFSHHDPIHVTSNTVRYGSTVCHFNTCSIQGQSSWVYLCNQTFNW